MTPTCPTGEPCRDPHMCGPTYCRAEHAAMSRTTDAATHTHPHPETGGNTP